MESTKKLKGFPLTFNIYAENEQEVEECRKAIIGFIGLHAAQCRAVTAQKVTNALKNWDRNFLIKKQIVEYFQS